MVWLSKGANWRTRSDKLVLIVLFGLMADGVMAQTGGGGGAGSGGAAGGGASSSTAAPSAGLGTATGRAANPFPTVPQTGRGSAQVPSAANAEPNSPVNRQAAPLNQADTGANGSAGTGGMPQRTDSQATPSGSSDAMDQDALPGSERPTGAGGVLPDQRATDSSTDPTALSSGGSSRLGDNRQGAAGATIEDCMKVWEPATHMTKDEWRRTCARTLTEYPDIETR